jgi:hypothetical protein
MLLHRYQSKIANVADTAILMLMYDAECAYLLVLPSKQLSESSTDEFENMMHPVDDTSRGIRRWYCCIGKGASLKIGLVTCIIGAREGITRMIVLRFESTRQPRFRLELLVNFPSRVSD